MNGAGNDFVVLDNRFYHFSDEELSELAAQLCRRRVAIGADGLLALAVPTSEASQFRMRYFNADGSLGTMCGNGARCLVRFALDAGIEGHPLRFDSDAGVVEAREEQDGRITIYLRPPSAIDEVSLTSFPEAPVRLVNTGTEHAVIFVGSCLDAPVEVSGPAVRKDEALAPAGANVNFVEIAGTANLRVRTFEKGVEAETLACGTGAIAAAFVAWKEELVSSPRVDVQMPGGLLSVDLSDYRRAVGLTGPAEAVYRGTVEVF
jgi:diaminopimelate epimerase